jgi:hypothetical protein
MTMDTDSTQAVGAPLQRPVRPAAEACPTCGSDCNERDELVKAEREIERLRASLKKANDQAERFERRWYLRGDALEWIVEATTATPALLNDVFTGSFFWRLISGTTPTNWRMRFEEYASGGALLLGSEVDLSPATNAALRGQRASSAYTVANASAAFLRHVIRLRFAAGAVNATLRLAVPQLERGAVATSAILNPVGAPAVTTRAADQLLIATTQERRQRILARLIERFEPTPAAIIGLASRLGSAVTLTEFRPHDCEDDCEFAVMGEPWAHAFQVAGGAQQVVEFTCEDTSETPLSQWRTGAYECAIRRFAPAHTVPIFTYA